MLPCKRFTFRHSGWLVIPVSLFLSFSAAFVSSVSAGKTDNAGPHHKLMESGEVTPFQKVFSAEADVVVLTFFDLYCVACQQSAGNFNLLRNLLIKSFPGRKIQMTGIGIGDTAFELSVFQKKYQLEYPSLPDPEKTFESPFAVRGTPTILVFVKENSVSMEIYRHEGRFRSDDVNLLVKNLKTRILAK